MIINNKIISGSFLAFNTLDLGKKLQ